MASECRESELTGTRGCLMMMSEVVLHQRSVPGPSFPYLPVFKATAASAGSQAPP